MAMGIPQNKTLIQPRGKTLHPANPPPPLHRPSPHLHRRIQPKTLPPMLKIIPHHTAHINLPHLWKEKNLIQVPKKITAAAKNPLLQNTKMAHLHHHHLPNTQAIIHYRNIAKKSPHHLNMTQRQSQKIIRNQKLHHLRQINSPHQHHHIVQKAVQVIKTLFH